MDDDEGGSFHDDDDDDDTPPTSLFPGSEPSRADKVGVGAGKV